MSESTLKQLKALRAQLRKWNDTLDHYKKIFEADGTVDAREKAQLKTLTDAIKKIEDRVSQKETELELYGTVTNITSEASERVSDLLSTTDDIVDHSLVNGEGKENTPTGDTSTTDTPTKTEPSSEATKYAAIAETPAVKAFLKGIHKSEGGYVDDPKDPGGKTKYGIAEKREWPAFAKMFGLDASNPALIKDITKKQVDEYYIKTRFEQNGLDKIKSTKVINAIFDQSILTPSLVKKNIKKALVALDSKNKFPLNNSEFSAEEITAINNTSADKLVAKFVEYQNAYYKDLAKRKPKHKKHIKGWLNRTARLTGFSGGADDSGSSDGGASNSGDSGKTFEVPSGWGLNKIAKEKGVSVEKLKEWNADKLKTYRNGSQGFNAGEVIVIKGGSSSGGSVETTFEVPSGWGLNKIAKEKGVSVENLKAWNADKLKTYRNGSQGFNVGEIITLKGGSSSGSSDSTTDEETGGDDGEVTAGGYIKPAWVKEAFSHEGKKETARMVKDDPWVKLLFEELGAYGWAKTQTVSDANWCAAFVSYCLKKGGKTPLTGFDGMRARTYADKFGKEVTRPVYGALAIVARGGAGHIGFVIGYNKKTKAIRLLGGNQGNKVSRIWETRKLLAYKVPSGWKVPEQNYLD